MNYCIAAFGVVLVISAIQWFVDGRKNFKGPRMEHDVLVAQSSHPDSNEINWEQNETKVESTNKFA